MSVDIYFSGLYVKIYKIKSGLGQRGGDICFPLKTPSSFRGIGSHMAGVEREAVTLRGNIRYVSNFRGLGSHMAGVER